MSLQRILQNLTNHFAAISQFSERINAAKNNDEGDETSNIERTISTLFQSNGCLKTAGGARLQLHMRC